MIKDAHLFFKNKAFFIKIFYNYNMYLDVMII